MIYYIFAECIASTSSSIIISDSNVDMTSDSLPKIVNRKRTHIQSSILTHLGRPMSLPRQQKINDLILNLITTDLQPLSVVEDKGFQELMKGLEPSYVIPSRFTFSNSFLPQKYHKTVEKIKCLIAKTDTVALTTDSWTAQHSQVNYICYTAHFITDEWNLHSCLLECGQYDESHNAQNIRDELFRVADEWGIRQKVFSVTSDNAANIKAAVKLTEWGHVGCFAHTINLIVQSGLTLKEIKPVQQKVKAIVEHFHRSNKANNKFLEIQKQMNEAATPLKLKNDVITRWNSTFYMFERFLQIKEPLTATLAILNSPVECLSETEWQVLKEVCSILKPFEQITREMSEEKNVTLSKVIIIVKGLRSAIENIKQKTASFGAKELVNHYEKEITNRFHTVETNPLMARCTFIDPRFKSKAFNSEYNFNMIKDRIESEVAHIISAERERNTSNEKTFMESESTSDLEENLVWADFDRLVKTRKEIDIKAAAILEVRSYLAEDLINRKENPLNWWKTRTAIYPHLAKLAKKYLCIIATSVASERIFSTAGQVITDRRNRLKGENVKKILFLHFNQDLCSYT